MELELIREISVNNFTWYLVKKDGKNDSYHLTLKEAERRFDYLIDNVKGKPSVEILKSVTI
jgi:hypothetical protein